MKVIIAGAGIGGLTTALALHADGHDVSVYESASEIRPLGVGINILPHAVRVLDDLGAMELLVNIGVLTRDLTYFNRHGQKIWTEQRGKFAGYQWPQVSVHRGKFQLALLAEVERRLGLSAVTTDRRLVEFDQSGSAVAKLQDKAGKNYTVQGDVLIACDGIHSMARKHFYPDEGPPAYSGRMLWRGMTFGSPYMTGASMIMAGHQNQKFVSYPISVPDSDGQSWINWIAELPRDLPLNQEDWNRKGNLEDFLPMFEDWTFDWLDIPDLIRHADAVYEFPMVDRDPVPCWTHDRVTLLGDAGHPMYPNGSNGASQAILDAEALAAAFSEHDDPAAALSNYEAERLPKTAAIVEMNRKAGPEICMELAEQRAPQGFNDVHDVISSEELEEIASRYKRTAGFDKDTLSQKE